MLLDRDILWLGLFIILSLFLVRECGSGIGRWNSNNLSSLERQEKTVGTVTGAMMALLGFMLAISISMAEDHFENRRKLTLNEAKT